jgi:hypothetical protein
VLDDPVPLHTNTGCGAGVRGTAGRWRRCYNAPAYAGELTFIYPRRTTCTIYLCEEHRKVLPQTRRLTNDDHAELQRRERLG